METFTLITDQLFKNILKGICCFRGLHVNELQK